jgi:glycerophosphoryl diester phosphodiesterase
MEIIAHGGIGIANTWGACQQAAMLGYSLELDVHCSQDGLPVLAHDPVRHRDGAPWASLHSSEGVLLQDVLTLPCRRFFIEVKEVPALLPTLATIRASEIAAERIVCISSNIEIVRVLQEQSAGRYLVGPIVNREHRAFRWVTMSDHERQGVGSVVIMRSRFFPQTLASVPVWPRVETILYTVNTPEEVTVAHNSGVVNGLITDLPILLPQWLQEQQA